ncbi:hypothetical protein [Streptomyces scabiei]|uniref:hypothetical protein n=1 Tax=Streptomyces scabiei TaxID=1930 RepID=UPI001B33C03C|nr:MULTISPECIES: hypothetical protein [Streptomyces]MBP5891028.1 hypothetical protein [Streptomyces sp. LBUM 1481]MBP5921173.1 hypothetical protein [Streptomyces sp. LBUM 1483]MDX2688624.1 hypothetical protein [Streptomyces scabiei]MDX2753780.1 hypothetical protein [Streptomyces scabiei]MDX2808194.1 hypothetical protein [Streptomyces scabiei]
MDFTKIAHAVEVDHGVKRVSMHYLKQFVTPSRERLSPELCQKISTALGELGILTLPTTLPSSEHEWVYLLSRDSALGQAVALSSVAFNMTELGVLPTSILDIPKNFPELAKLLT